MKGKDVTLMRYFLLALGIFEIAYRTAEQSLDWQLMFLIFLYIVNFQMRYFFAFHERGRSLSLILDGLLIALIMFRLKEALLAMPMIFIFDAWTLLERKKGFLFTGLLILIEVGFSAVFRDYPLALHGILHAAIGSISAMFAKAEKERKDLEETIYGMLEKENRLQKNSVEMESYIGSMRDIYTLKERNRISRDIHDSVGHSLSTIIIQLGAIAKLTEKDAPRASEMSEDLREFAQKGLQEVRQVLSDLKPSDLEENHISIALDELIQDFRQRLDLKIFFIKNEETWKLTEKQELALYRSVQEFLSNAHRHGKATEARIVLHYNFDGFILTMKDNGVGAEEVVPHLGLMGIEERVRELRGTIDFETAPGDGFKVQIIIPKEEVL